jgi:hypothetical protein
MLYPGLLPVKLPGLNLPEVPFGLFNRVQLLGIGQSVREGSFVGVNKVNALKGS